MVFSGAAVLLHVVRQQSEAGRLNVTVTGGQSFTLRLRSHTVFFFFQAEDGIRDLTVTGVQTCALPISSEQPILYPTGSPEGRTARQARTRRRWRSGGHRRSASASGRRCSLRSARRRRERTAQWRRARRRPGAG